ncbi:MAG: DUF2934 domain-containing protein [Phycisphaerales bacterium]|nr:DUF2934 domain-containing protein [Phycisphaerales bacterium]
MARTAPRSKTSESAKTTASSASPRGTSAADSPKTMGPTHDEIAVRAYEIFLARNGAPGDPMIDWMQAERELKTGRRD